MTTVPILSFRFKILLLVVAILLGVIGSTMVVTQRRVQATYQKLFARQYDAQVEFFNSRQRLRLADVMTQCQQLATNEQFVAAVEANDAVAIREASGFPNRAPGSGPPPGIGAGEGPNPADRESALVAGRRMLVPMTRDTYFKVYDANGDEILGVGRAERTRRLPQETLDHYKRLVAEANTQQVGYYRGAGDDGLDPLLSVVITPINRPETRELLGAMVMGLNVMDFGGLERTAPVQSGILVEGDLFSTTIPVTLRKRLTALLEAAAGTEPADTASFDIELNDEPYRCFVRVLNPGSVFPVARNVSLYSLADQFQDIREMRLQVMTFGTIVFVVGCILAWLLSQRLSVPLNELVVGTQEIEKGNYLYTVKVRSRDEVGQLAASFNQMAEGLAQKEKFQSVLNQVTDREVARKLMDGELALGGVMLPVTVLFCDIRGFSIMSQKLPPADVVRMLNEHMTAMTRVAYEFRGVVDKFVGDMIMVVFGAPESYGNDAENAVRCALKMVEVRNRLNESSAHKIHVGIGIATGEVLAGCMGSEDRLNYTVLGEKVNLASRLCDVAGRMDVLIDEETRETIGDVVETEELSAVRLKGFKEPVNACRVIRHRDG